MPAAARIYYQLHEDATVHPHHAVVLLHGAGGDHLYWPFNLRRLPGYRLHAVDLPGHGRSVGPGEQTISAYAVAIHNWLLAVGLEQAVLVGHSMGSAIALWLALEASRQVSGLVLIGAADQLKVNPALITSTASADTFPQAVETVIRWSFSRHAPPQLTRLAARRMAEAPAEVLHGDFLACDRFDVRQRLGEIRQPTLVMCGAQDKMTPPSSAQRLAEGISGARLEIVPSAGHMVMLEQPQMVAQILADFLTGVR